MIAFDLSSTTEFALHFERSVLELEGFVNVDIVWHIDDRKNTTEYSFILEGTTICWALKLVKIVALSTTEADYVAVTEASKEMVWLQLFLEDLGQKYGTGFYASSRSAIH